MNKAIEVMNAPEKMLAQLGLSEEKIELVKALAKDVKGEMTVRSVYDEDHWRHDDEFTVENMELEHVLYGTDSVADGSTRCYMCSVYVPDECAVTVLGVYKMHKTRTHEYDVCVACAHIGLNNPVYGDRVTGSLTGDNGTCELKVRGGEIVCVHKCFRFDNTSPKLDARFCIDYDSMPDYEAKHNNKPMWKEYEYY